MRDSRVISVLVRPPFGATQTFRVRAAETVGAFKARIATQVAVPAMRQRLVFAGRTLDDAVPFSDYNLGDESELMSAAGVEKRRSRVVIIRIQGNHLHRALSGESDVSAHHNMLPSDAHSDVFTV